MTSAAYVQANLYAGRIVNDDSYARLVSETVGARIGADWFQDTWDGLGPMLEGLFTRFPRQWGGFETMAELMELIAGQFQRYGLRLVERDGRLFINVP